MIISYHPKVINSSRYIYIFMRTFDWRSFERKGKNKEESKDEKLLKENIEELKKVATGKGTINMKEIAKQVLTEGEW